ncbi:serine/threonine-protein kinase/endoribonuclease IRE1a [Curcuma longa]|uniref:serine/threonine-protein kinase/endoribonuclease IRE1a n=1 Tax=Curcuma longa TaxID=136217 RepID=UPI003D9DF8AD
MRLSVTNFVSFFAVLVLGFLASGVLTPLVLDSPVEGEPWLADVAAAVSSSSSSSFPHRLSLPAAPSVQVSDAENASGHRPLSNDLVPFGKALASPGSRSILSLDENKHDKFLLALPNGTIYFMNRSKKPQWKLLTGQSLSYSWHSPSIVDPEYIVSSDGDGELYEYSKDSGKRKHSWSIEEYVQRAPIVEGSIITTGTKTSTFYVVDAESGELIYNDKEPLSLATVGVRSAREQTIASKLESGNATYITIIRTDYFLDSYEINNHLWSVMISRISAYNVGTGLPPTVDDGVELPAVAERNIPVYIQVEADQSSEPKLMLPASSKPNSGMWSGQHVVRSPECETIDNCSSASLTVSKSVPFELSGKPDVLFTSLDGTQGLPVSPKACWLGNCIAARPSLPTEHFRPSSGKDIPNASQKVLDDPKEYSTSEYSDAHMNLWFSLLFINGQGYIWLLILFCAALLMFCCFWLRKWLNYNKEYDDSIQKQSVFPKRKKLQKAGNLKSYTSGIDDQNTVSNGENAETVGHSQIQDNRNYSFINLTKPDDSSDGRWVGRLFVSNTEIGRGSNGTVVFEGLYDGRPVAVKRLLRAHHDVALKEIQNLIASDRHPNIVRWYGVEQDLDFVYISLERCTCSLSDLIQLCSEASESSSDSIYMENQTSNTLIDYKLQLGLMKNVGKEFSLWSANGLPSSQLLKLMRDVISGLAHLHELGIIHRDLKPQNVLISNDRYFNAKLSDMGISKRLLEDMSCLSRNATGSGSSGWQAPEQLLHGRQTRAVDLFSLGCILFFCITKGKHPFGNHFERDSNIVNNRMDLFLVDHIPEAEHLLCQLLHPDPQMRPNAVEVLHHPLFWSSETRLSFLRDMSDRIELEDRENESGLPKALENSASTAFGGKWNEKLDAAFITDMGRYRKYRFDCMRDLLRVIRNKLNHYRELPKPLQEILGPVPEGFDSYFASRFPKLLIEVYKVAYQFCKEEAFFTKYSRSSLS